MGLAHRLGPLGPLSFTLASAPAPCLHAAGLWRGAEAAGVADAMIEAKNSYKKSKSDSEISHTFSGGRNRRFLFKCARWSIFKDLLGALPEIARP